METESREVRQGEFYGLIFDFRELRPMPTPNFGRTELRNLAEECFGSLSPSESKFLLAAQTGDIAHCGPSELADDPNNDPTRSDRWGPEREVRAELLRWLCLESGKRNCVDPRGIQAHGAKITGPLDLSFISLRFSLHFRHCFFSEDINLHFIEVTAIDLMGSRLSSLYASYAKVRGTVALQGLQANGVVRLYQAQIDGNLECNGAKFKSTGNTGAGNRGIALHAEGAKIGGHIFLSEGFEVEGQVRLFGAEIGGNLVCDNGQFRNAPQNGAEGNEITLNAEQASVGGNVHLRNEFVSEGQVRFFAAEIGGNLDCDGGKFNAPSGVEKTVLDVESARVAGSALFREGFCAKGHVRLYHTQIGKNLECVSGRFESLELTHASAVAIRDHKQSWPQKGKLRLDGFTYSRIPEDSATVSERLDWLARHEPFSRHPYRQFARVLRESGNDQGARRVCAEMERRAWAKRDWISQPVSFLLRTTIGYGYFSLRALWWLLGLFVLGWVVYYQGYFAGAMVPTDKDAYRSLVADNKVPENYQTFHAAAYSLENSFPVVKLGVQDRWAPGSRLQGTNWSGNWWTSPGFLLWFRWGQTCVGWLLATLFVGGVTGIIRRE